MTDVQGTTVTIPTRDGDADAYLTHPADGRPHPGVLFYQDAYGLRPWLKGMADRLAAEGYTVLVPNVFYRQGTAPVVELPEFIDPAADPAIWERLGPLVHSLTPQRAEVDADAFLGWMEESPLVAAGQVAVTGYCMGARLALRAAATHPEQVAAVAGFHGGSLATEDPDSPHLGADRITAELYFGHADQDSSMPEEQIRRLDDALTAAGVRHTSEVYEGAPHGYTQKDTSSYDAAAEERHWEALNSLLRRTF